MTERPQMNVIAEGRLDEARPGYDHRWFEWSPLPERSNMTWPRSLRTAFALVINVSAVEWEDVTAPDPRPDGGRGLGVLPDVPRMSHREFGHRVGIFRLLDLTRCLGIRPAVAIDVLTAEHYPPVLERVVADAAEMIAGGMSASRPISSAMTEDEERDYVDTTLRRLGVALGQVPAGWLGAGLGESTRTLPILADAGLAYQSDWANDELPYRISGADGDLWSFPLSWELSDWAACHVRGVEADTWADSVIEAFDVVHAEGGRAFGLHLQPWISGQGFRTSAVDRMLKHIRRAEAVWIASPGEIVDHCRRQDPSHGHS